MNAADINLWVATQICLPNVSVISSGLRLQMDIERKWRINDQNMDRICANRFGRLSVFRSSSPPHIVNRSQKQKNKKKLTSFFQRKQRVWHFMHTTIFTSAHTLSCCLSVCATFILLSLGAVQMHVFVYATCNFSYVLMHSAKQKCNNNNNHSNYDAVMA